MKIRDKFWIRVYILNHLALSTLIMPHELSNSNSLPRKAFQIILTLHKIGMFGLPAVMIYCLGHEIEKIYFGEPYRYRTLILRENRNDSDLTMKHKTPHSSFSKNPVRYWKVRYRNDTLSPKDRRICKYLMGRTITILVIQILIFAAWVFVYQFYLYQKFPGLTVIDQVIYEKPETPIPAEKKPLKDIFDDKYHCHFMPI